MVRRTPPETGPAEPPSGPQSDEGAEDPGQSRRQIGHRRTVSRWDGLSLRRGLGQVRLGRLTPHHYGVGVLCALAATAYSVMGLVKLHHFRATIFDLVIFDQAVRGYAGFGPPTTPAVGAFHGQGLDFLQLADHFSPILAVLAPLYWIHAGPSTLILAQSLLFALAIPPIWLFTRRKLGTVPAYLVALTYATSAAIAQAAGFDFHEVAFVPVLTAVMIERLDRGRHLPVVLAAVGLLLVKEDMGLFVAGFGCYLLVTRRLRLGAAFVAAGLFAVALTRSVLIPAAGGDPATFWAFNQLGTNVPGVLQTMLTRPGFVLHTLVTPDIKLHTMLGLVWPLAFACLLSPLVIPALPMVLERMLSDRTFWWMDTFQYDAFVTVVLICAAVDGIARVQRLLNRGREPGTPTLAVAWAAAVCGISLALVPQHYLGWLLKPSFYRAPPDAAAAAAAAAVVPSGVVVDAVNNVGPALTGRATVLLWEPRAHDVDWVVADTQRPAYPFSSLDEQAAKPDQLVAAGYRIVFQRDGYVVLHRP
ncbi:MAG TPA: DUF2079 domain-containing protein [Actinopolymorphaceae bacterium]|nr:DUF2079 domain-containing protein [Actinopolymorphaceae bacterium]